MDDDKERRKMISITQIVKFKEFLKKWQLVALSSKTTTRSGSGSTVSRLRNSNMNVHCDSDEDSSCHSLEMPSDVPRGYLAVYVGPELRRFIIPTSYLSDKLFTKLLQRVEEEFGFDHRGGLTIPCDPETFKYLLQCMENKKKEEQAPPPPADQTKKPGGPSSSSKS